MAGAAWQSPGTRGRMDFFDTLRTRRSIRAFDGHPTEPEKPGAILDETNRAPSAGDLQAYEIYVPAQAKGCRTCTCGAGAETHDGAPATGFLHARGARVRNTVTPQKI